MYVCLIPYSSSPSLTPSTSHHTHPAIPSSTSQRVRLAHLPSCHARRPSNLPYARALPRQTAASSSTTLEGHQNSRTRNRPRCSCSVLRPLVGPAVPDRQHEQRASIPQPCSPSRLLVCPGSLPASRNCYRRPVRPSRSFKTCHPYHATHATHHSAMHDTPSPPCAHRDRSSAMIFSSSLCTYPAAQKQCIIVQGCLPPHWAPARSLSASIRPRCRSQGCRTSTRARVCRNARPSPSNFVPNEHRPSHTTTRNMFTFAGAP
jgi:hypothetical protein